MSTVVFPVAQPAEREDSFCLITGASQGLGRALAEECARRQLNLILVSLPGTGLPELVDELHDWYGIRVLFQEMDLTGDGAPVDLLEWIRTEKVPIRILVNNAGVGCHGLFSNSDLDQNEKSINLNIMAMIRLTHLLLPELQRHQSRILNVASMAAFYPMPYMPVYSSTKSFVLNFSLALRAELAGSSVGVSVLCPGGIMTNRACRARIALQGFVGRISCLYPEQVAREAVHKLFRGKAVIVPGWANKVIHRLSALVPRGLQQRIVASRFRHSGRIVRQHSPLRLREIS